jgi:hypothetical protein
MKAVETTVLNAMNFEHAPIDVVAATAKQVTEPFPVAQFIANLRLLPNLRCCTRFDLLKSVDDIMSAYWIETKQNMVNV